MPASAMSRATLRWLNRATASISKDLDFSPCVRRLQVVAARGSDWSLVGSEGDPLVGHKLGDLDVSVYAASARSAHDLAVGGSDTLPTGLCDLDNTRPPLLVVFGARQEENTSATGLEILMLFVASGTRVSFQDCRVEFFQAFFPPGAVWRGVMIGRKTIVDDRHLGAAVAEVVEVDGDQGFVFRGGRSAVPAPCVDQKCRGIDLPVNPGNRHAGPTVGLHYQPIAAAGA
jgi:hypothetical protein